MHRSVWSGKFAKRCNAGPSAATTAANPNVDAIMRALAPVIPDRVTSRWFFVFLVAAQLSGLSLHGSFHLTC